MSTVVPVAAIKRVCDPFRATPWGRRVTRAMVAACIDAGALYSQPLNGNLEVAPELHAGRIAFFVTHGWEEAIAIDVGVPALGCHVAWPVQDGNHRLAAAIYRGNEFILADVDGSVDYAAEMLGVNI